MSILSWSKQDGQMPSRAIDQNGVLLIPNVQERDAGNYVCTGSDMFNMDKAVATLIVNVGEWFGIPLLHAVLTLSVWEPSKLDCFANSVGPDQRTPLIKAYTVCLNDLFYSSFIQIAKEKLFPIASIRKIIQIKAVFKVQLIFSIVLVMII